MSNPGSDWNPVFNGVFLKKGLIRDDLPKIGQVLSTEIGEIISINISKAYHSHQLPILFSVR